MPVSPLTHTVDVVCLLVYDSRLMLALILLSVCSGVLLVLFFLLLLLGPLLYFFFFLNDPPPPESSPLPHPAPFPISPPGEPPAGGRGTSSFFLPRKRRTPPNHWSVGVVQPGPPAPRPPASTACPMHLIGSRSA